MSQENRTFYAEREDGFGTPCCGIGMWGDITENETQCPYCEKTFVFETDEDDEAADVQQKGREND